MLILDIQVCKSSPNIYEGLFNSLKQNETEEKPIYAENLSCMACTISKLEQENITNFSLNYILVSVCKT